MEEEERKMQPKITCRVTQKFGSHQMNFALGKSSLASFHSQPKPSWHQNPNHYVIPIMK